MFKNHIRKFLVALFAIVTIGVASAAYFSDFPSGGLTQSTDVLVGLRSGANTKFTATDAQAMGYVGIKNVASPTYTVLAADMGYLLVFNSSSPVTVTLPSGLGSSPKGIGILYIGGAQLTITGSGTTIQGNKFLVPNTLATLEEYATDTYQISNFAQGITNVSSTTSTNYSFSSSDIGVFKVFTSNSATSVTIPQNSTTPMPVGGQLIFSYTGSGSFTLVPAPGVIFLGNINGTATIPINTVVTLTQTAQNIWVVNGAFGASALKNVSDNTKSTVSSVNGTTTSGNIASFSDTAGTITDSGINVNSFTSGGGFKGVKSISSLNYTVSAADIGYLLVFTGDPVPANDDEVFVKIPAGLGTVGSTPLSFGVLYTSIYNVHFFTDTATLHGEITLTQNSGIAAVTAYKTDSWQITNGADSAQVQNLLTVEVNGGISAGNVCYLQGYSPDTGLMIIQQYSDLATQTAVGVALSNVTTGGTTTQIVQQGVVPNNLGFNYFGQPVYISSSGDLTFTVTSRQIGWVLGADWLYINAALSVNPVSISPVMAFASSSVTVLPEYNGFTLVSVGADNFVLPLISTLTQNGINYRIVNPTDNVINVSTSGSDSVYRSGLTTLALYPGQAVEVTEDGSSGIWYAPGFNSGLGQLQTTKAVATGYTIQTLDLGQYIYNDESAAATINVPGNTTTSLDVGYWFQFACQNNAGCNFSFDAGDTVIGSTSMTYGAVSKVNKTFSNLPAGSSVWQISQTNIPTAPTYHLISISLNTANISNHYAVGDTVTLAGGTYTTQAQIQIDSLHLATYNINGGTGYAVGNFVTFSGGTCSVYPRGYVVSVSTGAPTSFSFDATAHPGATMGDCTVVPTILSQGSATGSGTGVSLSTLTWGTQTAHIINSGSYTSVPSNPISQASTSGSGTGMQLNGTFG